MELIIQKNYFFNKLKKILSMFFNDKLALISIIFLSFMVFLALFGPSLINDSFTKMNLRLRNL